MFLKRWDHLIVFLCRPVAVERQWSVLIEFSVYPLPLLAPPWTEIITGNTIYLPSTKILWISNKSQGINIHVKLQEAHLADVKNLALFFWLVWTIWNYGKIFPHLHFNILMICCKLQNCKRKYLPTIRIKIIIICVDNFALDFSLLFAVIYVFVLNITYLF